MIISTHIERREIFKLRPLETTIEQIPFLRTQYSAGSTGPSCLLYDTNSANPATAYSRFNFRCRASGSRYPGFRIKRKRYRHGFMYVGFIAAVGCLLREPFSGQCDQFRLQWSLDYP